MIPLRWHLRSWNAGLVLYMMWVGIANLLLGINSIIWKDNVRNVSTFWAYFTTRFIYAATWAIPVAGFVINRRLYVIAKSTSVMKLPGERRREAMIDTALGVGIPILGVILHYINSCNSYDIYEEYGPIAVARVTIVYIFTITIPLLSISLVTAVYCALTIWEFNKRRALFKEVVSVNSGLTSAKYFRIMALAGVELLFTLPVNVWRTAVIYSSTGLFPYVSWQEMHREYEGIDIVSSFIWRRTNESGMELNRWSFVIGAIVFFGFFGFADEAKKHYGSALDSVMRLVGQTRHTLIGSRSGKSSTATATFGPGIDSMGKTPTIPVFVSKEVNSRRDSFDSISDISVFDEKNDKQSIASASSLTLNDRPLPDLPVDVKPDAKHHSHNMV